MEKTDTAVAEKPAAAKKSKKKVVLIVVAAVVALAVAKMFLLGGGAGAAAAPGETTTTTEAPGPIEVLEPVTLNLADGHYLKVGIALQLHGGETEAAHGGDADPRTKWAKALDLVIGVLGRRTFGELIDPNGRDVAKLELEDQLREAYPDVVETLYFTEFVLQ